MLQYLMSYLQLMSRDEEGQGLVEYALILVLVSIAVIVMLAALGGQIGTVFDTITATLAS